MSVTDTTQECARIRDVDNWPLYPLLPMKRGTFGPDMDLGIVIAADVERRGPDAGTSVRVFKSNLYGFRSKLAEAGSLDAVEHQSYTDVEAMVDDGWRGD